MFLWKQNVEIANIKKIQKGSMGGLYSALVVLYEENGKPKELKISTITFKKGTWAKFVSDPEIPEFLEEAGALGKPEAARPLGAYRA